MHEIYSENTVGIDLSIHTRTVLRKLEHCHSTSFCPSILFELRTMLTGASGALQRGGERWREGEKRGRKRYFGRYLGRKRYLGRYLGRGSQPVHKQSYGDPLGHPPMLSTPCQSELDKTRQCGFQEKLLKIRKKVFATTAPALCSLAVPNGRRRNIAQQHSPSHE